MVSLYLNSIATVVDSGFTIFKTSIVAVLNSDFTIFSYSIAAVVDNNFTILIIIFYIKTYLKVIETKIFTI